MKELIGKRPEIVYAIVWSIAFTIVACTIINGIVSNVAAGNAIDLEKQKSEFIKFRSESRKCSIDLIVSNKENKVLRDFQTKVINSAIK